MTAQQLFFNLIEQTKPNHYRQDQFLFNCLYEAEPEKANALRTTAADPFYRDERIPAFWEAYYKLDNCPDPKQ